KIEDVADGDELFQFLARQADVELAFDLRDDADHVNRVQAESFAEIVGFLDVLEALAGVGFEDLHQHAAYEWSVFHLGSPSLPPWQPRSFEVAQAERNGKRSRNEE